MKSTIVCIDLRMFNHIKLKEVCEINKIDFDSISLNKKNGFAKIWIDLSNQLIIAYTLKKDPTVRYTEIYSNLLNSVTPFSIAKTPKQFDVDVILEKITKHGIESLKSDEKQFLDNLK